MSQPASSSPAALPDTVVKPSRFFAALRHLPPNPTRYLWLPLLSGVVGGVGTALLARANVQAQVSLALPGAPPLPPFFTYSVVTFSGLFLSVVTWLLLWALGSLGAGKAGRAAEVYGATFVPQLLWGLLLLPLGALFAPSINLAAPDLSGLSPQQVAAANHNYLQAVTAQLAATPIMRLSTWGTYAMYLWQFALAFVGFEQLTGKRNAAVRGVTYPLALLLVLLLVGWLVSHTATSLLGG